MAKKIVCDYCDRVSEGQYAEFQRSVTLDQKKYKVFVRVLVKVQTDDSAKGDEAVCNDCAEKALQSAFPAPLDY